MTIKVQEANNACALHSDRHFYGGLQKNRSYRRMCLCSGVLLSLAASGGLQAQEESLVLEELQVTGSRIEQTGMTTPTPVTVMTPDELELLAPGTLMDALDQMPQFLNNPRVDSAGAASWVSTGGHSTVNMRGVGSSRTLVLVDGRRMVPSSHLGFVDVNQIPQGLMRRTEVVTGGASAAYGSDAVAGVTNFILDTTFTGFNAHIQGGISDLGDAESLRTSMAGGFAVGDNAHLILGGEFYNIAGIPNRYKRDWYKNWGTVNYGATEDVPNQTPQRERFEHVCQRTWTFGGLITTGPLAGTQFLKDGTPAPFHNREGMNPTAVSGLEVSTGANPSGIIRGTHIDPNCDDLTLHSSLRAAEDRGNLFSRLTYNLNDDTELSLQGLFGYNKITNQKGTYTFSSSLELVTIYDDNAFLPESVRQRMQDEGVSSFILRKEVPQSDPMNNSGLGGAPSTGKTHSWTAAIDGGLRDWRYSAYYQYGTSNRYVEAHAYRTDHFFRGVDAVVDPATGNVVCRSTLFVPDDGCVPINFFGLGNETPEARDYIHGYLWVDSTIRQHAGEFMMNGRVHDGWGAGPISVASGVSYREEDLDQFGGDPTGSPLPSPPDGPVATPLTEDGEPIYRGLPSGLIGQTVISRANAPTIRGGYDVWEVFFETLIPIVQGRRGAEGVSLNLAARYAQYSGSGGIWAWKGGFDWQIFNDLRFRMTSSRDVRAANLSERFNITLGGGSVTDPERDDDNYVISVISGGNPEVDPEYSDTITFGLVYQPSWLAGLSASADYFDIAINDAISSIGTANIVRECYDFGAWCSQIERGPDGRIVLVRNVFINVDQFRVRGGDIELAYRTPIRLFGGNERLTARAVASHMFENSVTPYQAPKVERAGLGSAPPWNATLSLNYNRGPLGVSWSERWRGAVKQNLNWESGVDVWNNRIGSQSTSNLRVTYNLDRDHGSYSMYGAISNVFDRDPGRVMGLSNIYGNIGRTYTFGLRYRN